MKLTKLLSVAFLAMVVISCKKSDKLFDNSGTTSSPSTVPVTVNKSTMLQLVNDIRAKGCNCGDTYYASAPAVTWNNQLEAAAYAHSTDMNQNNFFDHISKTDGSNPGNRIDKAGYTWQTYGENIAMGYATEADVMNAWLASPGHCKNIMNKAFKEMGVAKIGTYWAQEFAAK
jgi:uncharacterized protein YkwD